MAKILIIDDDPDIVESMKVVLESKGHEVISVSTGTEGLKKVGEKQPDLVILDLMMETIDKGFEVAREIKGMRKDKNIPVLMLTAVKEKVGFDFKAEAGDEAWLPIDEYCEKPLSPQELITKVDQLLKNKK